MVLRIHWYLRKNIQSYPLLNSLTQNPIYELRLLSDENKINKIYLDAIYNLKDKKLIIESCLIITRYGHEEGTVIQVPSQFLNGTTIENIYYYFNDEIHVIPATNEEKQILYVALNEDFPSCICYLISEFILF